MTSSYYYTKIYNQVYGINTNIFRITNSFGPKEQIIPNKNAINYLIHKAFKNEDVTIYNDGKFFRDVIYFNHCDLWVYFHINDQKINK